MIKKIIRFLIKNDIMMITIEIVGVIIFWRGIWGILDIYFFPGNPLISYILCILIGFFFISMNNQKNSKLKK